MKYYVKNLLSKDYPRQPSRSPLWKAKSTDNNLSLNDIHATFSYFRPELPAGTCPKYAALIHECIKENPEER